ncbi:MAG: polysaccharide deacetylase family protein [Thauera sp.]|nr:polysaccharide deacetylase family protein [Thauera sp.]
MHDVAPATWTRCAALLRAVDEVAPVPLTLLVVPDYHRLGNGVPGWYAEAVDERLARGDETALHGFTHLDDAPAPRTPGAWWRRRVMTAGEGEFAALDADEAAGRLQAGLAWCRNQGWPVEGFVAPAWQLGAGAWQALTALPLRYTTTADAFHLLQPRRRFDAPALAWSTRSRARRALSLAWNGLRPLPGDRPLRLALHPDDARHPGVVRQIQRLLEHLLREREPVTKRALAATLDAAYPGSTTSSESPASVPPSAAPASTSLG